MLEGGAQGMAMVSPREKDESYFPLVPFYLICFSESWVKKGVVVCATIANNGTCFKLACKALHLASPHLQNLW